jgi:hypothetical protein
LIILKILKMTLCRTMSIKKLKISKNPRFYG